MSIPAFVLSMIFCRKPFLILYSLNSTLLREVMGTMYIAVIVFQFLKRSLIMKKTNPDKISINISKDLYLQKSSTLATQCYQNIHKYVSNIFNTIGRKTDTTALKHFFTSAEYIEKSQFGPQTSI